MHISDFVRIGKNRSWRLAYDEFSDFVKLDLMRKYDFAERELENRFYIPSPARTISRAILEIKCLDALYRKDIFIDCAAGKGKPCVIALESGFKQIVAIERDAATFEVLTANLRRASSVNSRIQISTILDDFLHFDYRPIGIPKDSYVTFWLFDLKESLPSFFARISEICNHWGIKSAAVLLLSESTLPRFEGWEIVRSIDFQYDKTRFGHVYVPS